MKRYCIEFSYDGSQFCGYQYQPKLRTVQGELQKALFQINNHQVTSISSSGRTDRGVHALKQVAHFDLTIDITEDKLKRALNSNLPDDIHILCARKTSHNFHARYCVKTKEYMYKINLGTYNPIDRNYIYQCCHKLNIKKMKQAIKYLKGTHDYRAFVTENKEKENCVRTIFESKIKQNKEQKDVFEIYFRGTGFLKYQVRNMVGLLIKVGEGKIAPIEVKNILESLDRSQSGKTAPSEGLYLIDVTY